jgi:hypothetical protein
MTKGETEPIDERVERLLYADLTYDGHVEGKYGKASHKRMRELRELLFKSTAQALRLSAEWIDDTSTKSDETLTIIGAPR